jgi:hypothetical protein
MLPARCRTCDRARATGSGAAPFLKVVDRRPDRESFTVVGVLRGGTNGSFLLSNMELRAVIILMRYSAD